MTKIKTKTLQCKSWQRGEVAGTQVHCWWKYKMVPSLWKAVWQFSYTIKHPLTIWHSNPTPRYLLQEKWKLTFTQKTCTWMLIAALLINAPKLKIAQRFFSWWMDKETVHPYNGIVLSNIKESIWNMQQPEWISDVFCKRKEARLEHKLYNSIYVTFGKNKMLGK